jgi:outer membrane protein OmpA-like peptidoglycan-associated protein
MRRAAPRSKPTWRRESAPLFAVAAVLAGVALTPGAQAQQPEGQADEAASSFSGTTATQDSDGEQPPVGVLPPLSANEQPATDDVSLPPDPANQSPTISGLSGLFRVVTGDIGTQHSFRLALHTELLAIPDFLVSGDDNSRFIGTLALSYTPWRYLELFLNVRSQSNRNERVDTERLDREVILALGDFAFGTKLVYPLHRAITVGGQLGVELLNSVGGVSFDGDSTSLLLGAISTFDIGAISSVPLRVHLNFGYLLDNSDNLQDYGTNYTLESLKFEKFALGINRPRLQFKIGVDSQLRPWTKIGVSPIAELSFDVVTGGADADFARFLDLDITRDDFDGRATSWLTLGVRVNPLRGLAIDVATDIGLLSPGYGYGPPVTPWNIILGLSYAYDPKPITKVITRTRVRSVATKADTDTGKGQVRGRVIDAKTSMPIEGAVVTFPGKDLTGLSTDPDGGFLSYRFAPGTLMLMVRHPDYDSSRSNAQIEAGAKTKLEVRLQPAAPRLVKLTGTVVAGAKSEGVGGASIRLEGPDTRELQTDSGGRFVVELKPGAYTIDISSKEHGTAKEAVRLEAGKPLRQTFTLRKRLNRNLVKVTKKRILLRRKIHFASGRAELRPDAEQLLDLVLDALRENPQIGRLQIAGHTDNQGAPALNSRLSRERAEAVLEYLVQRGIRRDRLEAAATAIRSQSGRI